jgi:DNA polymerase-3 subunit alpha
MTGRAYQGYIHLRGTTPYSLLEGAIPIETLLAQAKMFAMPALAIADVGHLFGALEFSLACQKKGLHPIIGCQLSLFQEESESGNPIVLYAQNETGYRNLCHLVTSSTVGQLQSLRGHITPEQLHQHAQGLLLLTGGSKGPLDRDLTLGNTPRAEKTLERLSAWFPNRLYVEISRNEAVSQEEKDLLVFKETQNTLAIEEQLLDWAYEKGIPVVATNPSYFLTPKDYEAADTLRCIALGRYVQEEDRPRCDAGAFFRSPHSMETLFQDLPEALDNTWQIMKRCSFLLKAKAPVLPSFPTSRSEKEELDAQAQQGLEKRLVEEVLPLALSKDHETLRLQYTERLTYECEMIQTMGFSGYFLIVSDFIQWAKSQGIPVGPGRGSGASSLVAWSLAITDVDPIRFNLFFERFLNPERVSMPDFDVDFCQQRRDEVILYVREKYGADKVAQIITFGTLKARGVLRDVGRVLQMPYTQVDKICKLIPNHPAQPVTLQEALELEPQLKTLAEEDAQVHRLITLGTKLEGLYRHASTHAAGIIIGHTALPDCVPLYQVEEALLPATEFSLKYIEDAGLVKFDFLGLTTLTILKCVTDLLMHRGVSLHLNLLPLDDALTFDLLRRVETVGIFQLESSGMSDVLRQLQPENFEEIVALISLYRPGPMENIPRYLACRHGREIVAYAYPCLEEILKPTYGVMVYQEQVLQIARVLAGYSLGGADLLRRAMGKKIKAEMDAQRQAFVKGTLTKQGGNPETASLLFDQIAKFAGYAFPKAHSVPYALLAYQCAYLKAHAPVEFMTALMIHETHNSDKLRVFIKETKRMGIAILPPDINHSACLFSIVPGQASIRYGLSALKQVGVAMMEKVVLERMENGPFADIFAFTQRMIPYGLNKKHLESLIAAGAFDALYPGKRSSLMASVERLLRAPSVSTRQDSLFAMPSLHEVLEEKEPWSLHESLQHEFNAIGFYLTAHPLEDEGHPDFISMDALEGNKALAGKTFPMMGMVMEVLEKISKTGKKYAFVHLSDPRGTCEVTVFSDLLARARGFLVVGTPLFLRAQGRLDGELLRLTAQEILPLKEHPLDDILILKLASEADLMALHHTLKEASLGRTQCIVFLKTTSCTFRIVLPSRYHLTMSLRMSLSCFI